MVMPFIKVVNIAGSDIVARIALIKPAITPSANRIQYSSTSGFKRVSILAEYILNLN
jgi:hypothetical protein